LDDPLTDRLLAKPSCVKDEAMSESTQPITFARLSDQQRKEAMARFAAL